MRTSQGFYVRLGFALKALLFEPPVSMEVRYKPHRTSSLLSDAQSLAAQGEAGQSSYLQEDPLSISLWTSITNIQKITDVAVSDFQIGSFIYRQQPPNFSFEGHPQSTSVLLLPQQRYLADFIVQRIGNIAIAILI